MAQAAEEFRKYCVAPRDVTGIVKFLCGRPPYVDLNCLGGSYLQAIGPAICGAYTWTSVHPARTVEFWSEDGRTHLFTMRHRGDRRGKTKPCLDAWIKRYGGPFVPRADNAFTVDVPGVSDIIKWPGFSDTPELRRARAQRLISANRAVPDFLKWLPPILTQLDNAQDMLITGLALAWPLVKYVFPRMLGGLGILLTLNDLLNLFT